MLDVIIIFWDYRRVGDFDNIGNFFCFWIMVLMKFFFMMEIFDICYWVFEEWWIYGIEFWFESLGEFKFKFI